MATIIISIADLGNELRRLPRRNEAAILRAVHNTLAIDAYRWFDWSIRGGGLVAPPARTGTGPKKPPKAKIRVSLLGRIVKRLKGVLSLFRKKAKKPKAKKPPAPRGPPPGYRVPVDRGFYAASGRHDLNEKGGMFYSADTPPIKVGVIEEGRRPAFIPIRPLVGWARRKFGLGPDEAKSAAFAISTAASKTRRPGLHVFARMHPKIAEALHKNIDRERRAVKPGT